MHLATTAERDILISEELKKIIIDNTLWTHKDLRKELNSRGFKGMGSNQIYRCAKMAGFDHDHTFIGTCEAIESKKKEREEQDKKKRQTKRKSKTYEHPNGSEKIYKKLLQHNTMASLDKRAAIYCFCIDGVCIYIGQSVSLLRRLADHQYWIENEDKDSPNDELYKLIRAARDRDRMVTLVVPVMVDSTLSYNVKKETLDVYESEMIRARLPIANKAIPNVFGVIEHTQRLHVGDDNINEFFTPEFNERRDFLDIDYRQTYSYIFNPYYDEKYKKRLYYYQFVMSDNQS